MDLTQTVIDDAISSISTEQAGRIRKAGVDDGGNLKPDALVAVGMMVGAMELGDRLIKLLDDGD